MKKPPRGASEVEPSIWKWSMEGSRDQPASTPFYATQLGLSFVLVANNIDDLKKMALDLAPNACGAQSLIKVRELEDICAHDVWGYRRYKENADEDPNSMAAATQDIMPGTRALAFFVDFKQRTGVLRLFSSTAATADNINAHLQSPFLSPTGSQTWQATIPFHGNEDTFDQMFRVMSLFGFGAYL
jgi:hypothetical protein